MPLIYSGPKIKQISRSDFRNVFTKLCVDDIVLIEQLLSFDKSIIDGNKSNATQIGKQILDYIREKYGSNNSHICITSVDYYLQYYIGITNTQRLDKETRNKIQEFVNLSKQFFTRELFGIYIHPDLIEYMGYDLHPLIVPSLTYHVIFNYVNKTDPDLFKPICKPVYYQIATNTQYQKIVDFFIRHHFNQTYIKFLLSQKDIEVIVATNKEERIIGALVFEIQANNKVIYIHELLVDQYCRRHGIAKKLLLDLEQYAKDKKITKIRLAVHVGNKIAITLYEKLGYRQVDQAISYLIYEKTLT